MFLYDIQYLIRVSKVGWHNDQGKNQPPEVRSLRPGRPLGCREHGLAERVSAATLAKMIRQKETFLLALRTHIATHTRHWERQGWRLSAKWRRTRDKVERLGNEGKRPFVSHVLEEDP